MADFAQLYVLPRLGECNEQRNTARGKFHIQKAGTKQTFCGLWPDAPSGRWVCGGAVDWDDPSYFEGRICKHCLRLTTEEERRQ